MASSCYLLAITLIILIGGATAQSYNQVTILYESTNQNGASHAITETYRPNLGSWNWNDRAFSACANGV